MKITDILGFKYNGIEAIEAKLNGIVVWKKASGEIEFASCPFPTSWTQVTRYKKYKATNTYGEWIIESTNSYSTTDITSKAFDNDDSTYWRVSDTDQTLQIDCPVPIKPTHIYQKGYDARTQKIIEGFNSETQVWEEICNQTSKDIDVDISTNNYYSKFRLSANYTNVSYRVYEFQITSGFIKGA